MAHDVRILVHRWQMLYSRNSRIDNRIDNRIGHLDSNYNNQCKSDHLDLSVYKSHALDNQHVILLRKSVLDPHGDVQCKHHSLNIGIEYPHALRHQHLILFDYTVRTSQYKHDSLGICKPHALSHPDVVLL